MRSDQMRELGGVGVLERVLVLGAADAIFDGEILQRLEEALNAVDLRDPGLQAADDVGGAGFAGFAVAQVDLDAAAVERHVGAVDADKGGDAFDVGILEDDAGELLLAGGHGAEGDGLGASVMPRRTPVSCTGKKPLGTMM